MSRNSNPSINSPASTTHELDTLVGEDANFAANLLQEFNDRQTRHISVSSTDSLVQYVPHSPTPPIQEAASTSSTEWCTPGRPNSTTSGIARQPPTCRLGSSGIGDEWTSKCPPTGAKTSSPSGSESWGTERSSPEPGSTLMKQNTWSPYTSHQTTHSDPLPPSPTGSSNSSKQGGEPTTPWLRRHT